MICEIGWDSMDDKEEWKEYTFEPNQYLAGFYGEMNNKTNYIVHLGVITGISK